MNNQLNGHINLENGGTAVWQTNKEVGEGRNPSINEPLCHLSLLREHII